MLFSIRKSLQKKFILITFVSVLILAVVVCLFVASRMRAALYNATEKRGRMLAQTVSALIINELIYEQLGLVEEGGFIDNYIRELDDRDDLELNYVAVLNDQLQVISHSDFGEFGKYYSEPFIKDARYAHRVLVRETTLKGDGVKGMEFITPLSIEGKRWGILLFSLSLAGVEKEAKTIFLQVLFLTVLALMVLFLLILFLSQRFIRPIIDLSNAMAEVDVGMLEKTIPVRGDDELSQLAASYNEMVLRIRQANEEMKLTHEKLLQSEKLATLGVLSSTVAHRINNPLGGLFNCVRMLKKKGADPLFRENYLTLVEEGLESIEETVGQLLWTAGKREAEEKKCDLEAVLGGVVKYLDYRMNRQGITYIEKITPGLSLPVRPHDMEEILLNIMINAIQAMTQGGELEVSCRRADATLFLKIRDTGVGIAEEKLGKVFNLFYSTKKAGEGTGLGMWMTYELVVKYKGNIEINSTEGVGTTVEIAIPEGR